MLVPQRSETLVATARGSAQDKGQSLGVARYLAWVALILVLALTAVLSIYISNAARNTLVSKQRGFAAQLADNLNNQIYRRFTLPTVLQYGRIALRRPDQYERLDQVVQSTIHGLHLDSLRIYAHDHTVTYSTDQVELGRTDLASGIVDRAAMADDPIFNIDASLRYWQAFFQFPLRKGTFILRTTYPLRIENRLNSSEEEGPIMGVLEFTQDITADMQSVIRFQQLIIVVTLASTSLLLMLLLFFIRRAEKAIGLRIREEQRLLLELHQSEKLASMGRMVASIAHEIRNPLGIIRSSAELLLKRPGARDPVTVKILQAIYDETKRLSQTVSDFLDYARPLQPRQDTVDVAAVIREACSFLEPEFTRRQILLVLEGEPEGPLLVAGDKDLLYRAFYNLLGNALQAVGESGGITVSFTPAFGPKKEVSIAVHDSGPGFPAENLDKLLDPFFTTKDDGTGLGLPIVKNILTGHGGTLTLGNAPDGGALVRATLPALDASRQSSVPV